MAECAYNLRGEIDLAEAPRVREDLAQIVRASATDLVIDCTGLTFIDSTGVAVLLEAERDLAEHDRNMVIVNAALGPRRVFELLGLSDLLRYDQAAM